MPPAPLTERQVAAYLEVLGVARAAPGLRALADLVRAQVTRVPFENISKLYDRNRLGRCDVPDVDLYLERILGQGLGGTCYPNAFHFRSLLLALGYEAALCGAAMASGEDVHVVITVALDGRELLVDVGYGAPFFDPLPLDVPDDVVVGSGSERWVLRPRDAARRSRLDYIRDGEVTHGYLVNPTPREVGHFREVVRASYADGATFMHAVRVVRHDAWGTVALHNLRLARSSAGHLTVETAAGPGELPGLVERAFGIPADFVREAIAGLGPLRGLYD